MSSSLPPRPAPLAAAPSHRPAPAARASTRWGAALALVALTGPGSPTAAPGRAAAGPVGGACPAVVDAAAAVPTPPLAREFRAAWISPVEGGEWPSRPAMSDAEQQAELRAALDRAVAVGLNAVVLHVRPAADALYPTARAPWSSYLVRGGAAPAYDPLAFAVGEAHRRGLQLHVWFNPFRAAPPDGRGGGGARALTASHPEWVVRYGSQTWIDPGFPAARQAVLDAILEVVDRYDVDGVHLDDYFYPYREDRRVVDRVTERVRRRGRTRTVTRRVVRSETIAFPDGASWARHGDGFADRASWRRENVSRFVEALYREVKARRPGVLVGISPFGIWRSNAPRGVTGLDAYGEIYADSRRWWREGWVDYLAPQLYWALDGEQRRFVRLDAWWRGENVRGRHLWPGLLTMRAGSRGAPWPLAEIPRQIGALRAARLGTAESQGHVHFRLGTMLPGARAAALGERLASESYPTAAIPPASPWLGAAVPAMPRVVACADGALQVAAGDTVTVRWWVAQWRDAAGRWQQQLRTGTPAGITLPTRFGDGTPASHVVVRPLSWSGVEGAPVVVALQDSAPSAPAAAPAAAPAGAPGGGVAPPAAPTGRPAPR